MSDSTDFTSSAAETPPVGNLVRQLISDPRGLRDYETAIAAFAAIGPLGDAQRKHLLTIRSKWSLDAAECESILQRYFRGAPPAVVVSAATARSGEKGAARVPVEHNPDRAPGWRHQDAVTGFERALAAGWRIDELAAAIDAVARTASPPQPTTERERVLHAWVNESLARGWNGGELAAGLDDCRPRVPSPPTLPGGA